MASVHDVPTDVVETCKRDSSGDLITGRTVLSLEVSFVAPAERRVVFDETAAQMRLERDGRVDIVSLLTNDMDNLLAVEVDVKDESDLQDIPPSGAIDVRSSLGGNFSVIQERCCLYGLDGPTDAGMSFGLHFGI